MWFLRDNFFVFQYFLLLFSAIATLSDPPFGMLIIKFFFLLKSCIFFALKMHFFDPGAHNPSQ